MLLGRVERREQVEHLAGHDQRTRVATIDLVDRDDRPEPDLQRLRHHEFGLRQRTFGRIHQNDRAVHHVEDAFDLAAEIGMAGRIDDVDAHILPDDRGHLGEDGDAALTFEVVGIHRALGDALVLAERARLLQEPIDQRGLAVVDMSDDGDIAKLHAIFRKRNAGHFGPRAALNIVPIKPEAMTSL